MLKFIVSIVFLISGFAQAGTVSSVVTSDGTRFELAKPGEKVVVMQPGEQRFVAKKKCTAVNVDWLRATHTCVADEFVLASKEGVVKTGGEKTVFTMYRLEVLGSIAGMGLMALAMVLFPFTKIDSASSSVSTAAIFIFSFAACALVSLAATSTNITPVPVTPVATTAAIGAALVAAIVAVFFNPLPGTQRKWFYTLMILYQGFMVLWLVLVL